VGRRLGARSSPRASGVGVVATFFWTPPASPNGTFCSSPDGSARSMGVTIRYAGALILQPTTARRDPGCSAGIVQQRPGSCAFAAAADHAQNVLLDAGEDGIRPGPGWGAKVVVGRCRMGSIGPVCPPSPPGKETRSRPCGSSNAQRSIRRPRSRLALEHREELWPEDLSSSPHQQAPRLIACCSARKSPPKMKHLDLSSSKACCGAHPHRASARFLRLIRSRRIECGTRQRNTFRR
jgi:hypothetical protein